MNEIIKRYVQTTGAKLFRDIKAGIWIVTTPEGEYKYDSLEEMVQDMTARLEVIEE